MWLLTNILLPTLCSFVATYLFWNVSAKLNSTRLKYAPKIELSLDPYNTKSTRLRIKLINVGFGDIYDVNYMVRLSYRQNGNGIDTNGNAYQTSRAFQSIRLDLGQRSFAPVIYGRKKQRKHRNDVYTWTLRLHRSKEFYKDFSRSTHPDWMRKLASEHLLTFEDVLEVYKSSVKITVFAFGIDSLTGVERIFRSKDYRYEDIVKGMYHSSRVWKKRYKEYADYVLGIEELQEEKTGMDSNLSACKNRGSWLSTAGHEGSVGSVGGKITMAKTKVDLNNKIILVTGSPGFIGANLVLRLLSEMSSGTVISFDSMNDYYEPKLKEYRLSIINSVAEKSSVQHIFIRGNLADKVLVDEVFEKYKPSIVVNLAAQAGVRYSIDHPDVYIESNIIGFFNILEACRRHPVEHLVYASSSSVYGGNKKVPFSVDDKVDNPVSLYAATKKSNELLAHSYSKLYNIPSTGLRFFTVYGPAGRPDMFYYSATQKLVAGETIKIFNYGDMKRDFTYVDDIVEGVVRVMQGAPERIIGEDGLPIPPYAVYNIGGGTPENLLTYISTLQEELVRAGVLPEDYDFEGHRELVGMQPGDVPITYADSKALEEDYGFRPKIDIRTGLRAFAEWYKDYYKE